MGLPLERPVDLLAQQMWLYKDPAKPDQGELIDDPGDEWRVERRNFITEIEQLEESVERARQTEKQQILEDLQSELRFQLEEAIRSRLLVEQDLASAEGKFEREKNSLKAQITAMQATVLEAMERTNTPGSW